MLLRLYSIFREICFLFTWFSSTTVKSQHGWLTDELAVVSRWIHKIEHVHRRRLSRLIVGLHTKWCLSSKPNAHRVATLWLCVGHKYLIFQPFNARYIPKLLFMFLANVKYTFVGVGVDENARKLTKEYGIHVSCTIDILGLAVERLNNPLWRCMGLKTLSEGILCKGIEKPKEITLSGWDNKMLTDHQIEYGCLDAFASFELGRVLRASSVSRVFDGWNVRIDEKFVFVDEIYL